MKVIRQRIGQRIHKVGHISLHIAWVGGKERLVEPTICRLPQRIKAFHLVDERKALRDLQIGLVADVTEKERENRVGPVASVAGSVRGHVTNIGAYKFIGCHSRS